MVSVRKHQRLLLYRWLGKVLLGYFVSLPYVVSLDVGVAPLDADLAEFILVGVLFFRQTPIASGNFDFFIFSGDSRWEWGLFTFSFEIVLHLVHSHLTMIIFPKFRYLINQLQIKSSIRSTNLLQEISPTFPPWPQLESLPRFFTLCSLGDMCWGHCFSYKLGHIPSLLLS